MSEIIAKAMNSTLGTAKFVAFDKIMHYKSVDASDTTLITISEKDCETCTVVGNYNGTGKEATKAQNTNAVKFEIPTLSGTVKLATKLVTHSDATAAYKVYGECTLLRNDVEVLKITNIKATGGTGSGNDVATDIAINELVVLPGDVFTLKLSLYTEAPAQNYGGTMKVSEPIRIKGTTRDYIGVNIL